MILPSLWSVGVISRERRFRGTPSPSNELIASWRLQPVNIRNWGGTNGSVRRCSISIFAVLPGMGSPSV
jgi:hypothetical protein